MQKLLIYFNFLNLIINNNHNYIIIEYVSVFFFIYNTAVCGYNWVLLTFLSFAACEESESCSAVSIDSRESAMRCVMYPDTHTCLPTTSGQRCLLVIKEPAQSVYIRTGDTLKQNILQFTQVSTSSECF